jgi:hypothetical protein
MKIAEITSLNPMKTEIIEGPVPPEHPWRVNLSQFNLRTSSDAIFVNDLHSLFSLAFDLSRQNPNDAVLGYAINRVKPRPTGANSWEAFSNLMLAAIAIEPSSIRFVSEAMIWALSQGLAINKDSVTDALNNMCLHHAPLEHGSEVAWSLAIMRDLDLTLSSDSAARVARMQDNCSLLLLFDFLARKRVGGDLPDMTAAILRAEDLNAWKAEDWLLGYECSRNKWANDKHFQAQPHWSELLQLDIPFFAAASVPAAVQVPVATSAPPVTQSGATQSPTPVVGDEEYEDGDEDEEWDEDEDEDEETYE